MRQWPRSVLSSMRSDPSTALDRYIASKDAAAFDSLVEEHRRMVESTCVSVLGPSSSDLDDAVQETFIKLARSATAIHGNVGAWLHRCARTTAIDRWRARWFLHFRDDALAEEDRSCPAPDHASTEQLQIVRECLAELPDHPREVLQAYYFERRSQREIARELGISHVMVGKRLVTALDLLRGLCVRRGVGAAAIALLLGAGADGASAEAAGAAAPQGAHVPTMAPARAPAAPRAKALALVGAGLVLGLSCLALRYGRPQPPHSPTRDGQPSPAAARASTASLTAAAEAPGWMVLGDLPIRLVGDRAVFTTQSAQPAANEHALDGMLDGCLRTDHAWRLDRRPVVLRLVADLPKDGRYALHLDAMIQPEGGPEPSPPLDIATIYWQSAPLLRVDPALAPCFAGLGDHAFALSGLPRPLDQEAGPGPDPIVPLAPGRHAFAIAISASTVRTSIDGRALSAVPMPPIAATALSLRFQVGITVPIDRPGRTAAVTISALRVGRTP